MKTKIAVALLFLALAACAPATMFAPTEEVSVPTAVLSITSPTATAIIFSFTPTPAVIGISFVPLLTPDAIQLQRWREYQTELAKALFAAHPYPKDFHDYDPEAYKTALCEWDILGRESQVIFVFVDCIGGEFYVVGNVVIDSVGAPSRPAGVFLETDGSIRNVVIPDYKFDYRLFQYYDLHLFPLDVKEKLCLYYFYGEVPECRDVTSAYQPYEHRLRPEKLHSNLVYRVGHPSEPPLVILSATLLPTP